MKIEWPLLLVVTAATIGAIIAYAETHEIDFIVGLLAFIASSTFGALLYSLGADRNR